MDSLCTQAASLSRSPDEARRCPRREDSPFMSQFPPEEMMGTSREEAPTLGLPARDPDCRKEDFQLGRVCTFFPEAVEALRPPSPEGGVLESAATVAPSRDDVRCEGRLGALGLLGSGWLCPLTSMEPQPTVHGGPPRGEAGPSAALAVKSWLCLRMSTVIRCCTSEVPSIMVTGSSTCGRSMLGPKTVARFWTLILLTFEWA